MFSRVHILAFCFHFTSVVKSSPTYLYKEKNGFFVTACTSSGVDVLVLLVQTHCLEHNHNGSHHTLHNCKLFVPALC